MSLLRSLSAAGRALVDERFLARGVSAAATPEQVSEFSRPVPIDRLSDVVETAMRRFKRHEDSVDRYLAPLVHEALPLTRREAADLSVWHWLAVVKYPTFVRHRWAKRTPPGGSTQSWAEERFVGGLTKGTFSRMWWIAELTHEPPNGAGSPANYTLTDRLLHQTQDVVQLVFEHRFAWHRPCIDGFLSVVKSGAADVPALDFARDLAKRLRLIGATIAVETLDAAGVASLLRSTLPRNRKEKRRE